MNDVAFCFKCISRLKKLDSALAIYSSFCEVYTILGECVMMGEENPWRSAVRVLEKKGFLVSTETEHNCILIKPVSFEILEDSLTHDQTYFFCTGRCQRHVDRELI